MRSLRRYTVACCLRGSYPNDHWAESERDFLTGVDYNDGLANEVWTWSYDAAGNRNGGTYDNLNRLSAYSSHTYTNDILGNRTGDDWGSGNRVHEWDCLNRLTLRGQTGSWNTNYVYRADGMRVRENGVNNSYTGPYQWRYDGQMMMEQSYGPTNSPTVIRSGLGARGLDYQETITNTTTTVTFPVYDAHGNNVAHLNRNGTGYQVGNRRSYDVLGPSSIRCDE